jgi:hypothetical protein
MNSFRELKSGDLISYKDDNGKIIIIRECKKIFGRTYFDFYRSEIIGDAMLFEVIASSYESDIEFNGCYDPFDWEIFWG